MKNRVAKVLRDAVAGDLWARFVTEFPEDQRLLGRLSQEQFNYRPVITNYGGNVQEVIRHRLGEASTFAQCALAPEAITMFLFHSTFLHGV